MAVQTAAREGTVVERPTKKGITYALRFIAYGERRYLTLGREIDGWTREAAETELVNIMADVRRGIWQPPEQVAAEAEAIEEADDEQTPTAQLTFHVFSEKRLDQRQLEVSKRMWEYEEWALRLHLWPYFGPWLLSEFNAEAVDEYRRFKLEESARRRAAIDRRKPLRDGHGRVLRPLSASSINKTIDVLGSYLSVAVDYYGGAVANAAQGKRRRLKVPARRPVHLDGVGQIMGLLDAAADMDASAYWRTGDRLALIATLLLAGPRAEELGELLWRDVDLVNRRLYVGRSKTAAGLREIPMLPLLYRILVAYKACCPNTGPDDYVFPTEKGTRRDKDNIRNRMLAPVLAPADELLLARGEVPLPKGVTPHKLRHTFASILVACGEDPTSVMAQLGHTDPRFTLKVYSHMMRRSAQERARLKAYVYDVYDADATAVEEPLMLLAGPTRELVAA